MPDNIDTEGIQKTITEMAKVYGIDPKLALDVATAESNLNPKAIGKAGEVGLFQIHPKYLNYITKIVTGKTYSKKDLMDPTLNAKVGVGYLSILKGQLREKYSPALLIQTYNQGYGYTKKHNYQISSDMLKHPNNIYRAYFTGENENAQ